MELQEALRKLAALGTAQNRKVYARHGVSGDSFGVSYANLAKLEKEIGVDHDLARALWKTGNHDARVLATKIADPAKTTARLLEDWAGDLGDYVVTDALAKLASRTSVAPALVEAWTRSPDEWIGAAGWIVLAASLEREDAPDDERLARRLAEIEARIHAAPNRTRYSMNLALIAIGSSRASLRGQVLAAAKRIGRVDVDHGETGCKTPDAAAYIAKVIAYREKARKGARAAASPRLGVPPKKPRGEDTKAKL